MPGQGQIDLGQDWLGWGIRGAEVGLLATAYMFYGIRNTRYAQAEAALTQSDQNDFYKSALNAHNINNLALLLAVGIYVFNVGQAYVEGDKHGYAELPAGTLLAFRVGL